MHFGSHDGFFSIDSDNFGTERAIPFISVLRAPENNRLCLGAGYIQGVQESDEYALYPFDASEDDTSLITVKVSTVRAFTSDLIEANKTVSSNPVETGWKAKLLTSLSSQKVLVQLTPSVNRHSQWVTAARRRRHLHIISELTEAQPCQFIVKRDKDRYFILDTSGQSIESLPPTDAPRAVDSAMSLLEHLATFKYIEAIENRTPSSDFEESFEICLKSETGKDFGPIGIFEVNNEDTLSLSIQNFGTKALYVSIFDMGPSWQVDSLTSEDGGGDYVVVPPKNDTNGHAGTALVEWMMVVPEWLTERGRETCEDVIKVFVTDRPISFELLELPKVSGAFEQLGRPLRGHRDQLFGLLSSLKSTSRTAQPSQSDGHWLAINYIIRTHVSSRIDTLN
ncbi:uncharacterized protein ASPGLDRAFT_327653 [Aspergillus glaucus CBS 516.65]|uniref:Uncharacterized protein n=1 Tax=Aspergillus glaucus CBS 516.65 TaxID=1160497 RepID=A0A1L9VKF5_ASPGL|nr:hypothetical protein ASPGLDRAFT_327653 [Aspergillus glaucus CBS 516.65]OJJ84360.1 hypothetical protein ASPGLDRAFT_327653 [Aspergillus glaucus CBS 516.65]